MNNKFSTKIYENISAHIDVLKANRYDINLFSGRWGVILFLFYYEAYREDNSDLAADLLGNFHEHLYESNNLTFCTGLSGSYWLINHLHQHDFIQIDEAIFLPLLNQAIVHSNIFLSAKNFDFLHGSTGIVNFLTEFAQHEHVRDHLASFVNELYATSIAYTKDEISLPIFYNYTEPPSKTGIDAISLSHGNCSILLILLKIYNLGIEPDKCFSIIHGNINFLIGKKNPPELRQSLFPAVLDGENHYSRLSWCYGDSNLALTLWRCGKHFEKGIWQDQAIEIINHSLQRNTCESAGVVDACLCHGASGNAVFFLRMWEETKNPDFLKAAHTWREHTEKMIEFSDGQVGIASWSGDKGWKHSYDFLNGSVGAGLAFLNFEEGKNLPWDKALLLS